MTKLGFIGFGLIGASIAKALKAKKPGKYSVYVYDYHKDANPSLEKAVADGCIDSLTNILLLRNCVKKMPDSP